MDDTLLAQRRRWLHHFPDGTIEFLVVTRVLSLLLLLSTAIITSVERAAVLVAIAGLLWADYVLTLWWLVQLVTDHEALTSAAAAPTAAEMRRRRMRIVSMIALPAVMAALALAPWPTLMQMMRPGQTSVARFEGIMRCILLLLYLATLVPAYRGLTSLRLGSGIWKILFLVPLLHWLAVHRIIRGLEARFAAVSAGQARATEAQSSTHTAAVVADVAWLLGVLPWIVIAVATLIRGQYPSAAAPFCGSVLAAFFAIVNLAALEHLQRSWAGRIQRTDG